jgi:threonine dehydrogenase-like Zn-dependent dehydrogenase
VIRDRSREKRDFLLINRQEVSSKSKQCTSRAERKNYLDRTVIFGRTWFEERLLYTLHCLKECRLNDGLEEGAVLENFGIAAHAVELEHRDVGDSAVIQGGAGHMGILAAQT